MRPKMRSFVLAAACAVAAVARAPAAADAAPGSPFVMPWMCLERCGDGPANISAQLASAAAHTDVLTAMSFELWNLGPNSTLVANNLTAVAAPLAGLGLQTWAMVSSYPYPPAFLDWMRQVFANPAPFVDALIAGAHAAGLTGVNIDWEPAGGDPTPGDALAYAAFLDTLADALHAADPPLRVSVDFADWSPIWNLTALGATRVDQLVDMGTYTGNLTVWEQQLDDAVAGIPLDKLVVGLEPEIQPDDTLAARFGALAQRGIRSVGIWRMPVPDSWWPYLAAL